MCYTGGMTTLTRFQIRALLRRRNRLLQALGALSRVMRGSYLERHSTCTRPGCACHQGERHGPRAYLVVTREQKQRQVYVPKAQVRAVRAGIQQYHRMLALADGISEINLELMRGGALDESVE